MTKKILSGLRYFLFLGAGIFIAWWSLKDLQPQDWQNMGAAFAQSRVWLMVPVFFLLLLSHAVRALRWKLLMQPLDFNPGFRNTFLCILMGYFINMFLPRAGEIARCTVLSKYEDTDSDRLLGTVIAERSIDFLCLTVLVIIAFYTQGTEISGYISHEVKKLLQAKSGFFQKAWIFLTIAGTTLIVLSVFIAIRFRHIRFVMQVKQIITGILNGLIALRFLPKKGLFLLYTLIIWLLYYFSTWVGTMAIQDTAQLGTDGALSVLVLGSFGMIATPNGVGAYPEIVKRAVNVYGIFKPMDIAFGLMMWASQTFFIIIGGTLSFLLLPALNKKKATVK